MKTAHPIEEALQEYAISSVADDRLIQHIRYCKACQQQLATYRLISEEIKLTDEPRFEFDLAATVLAQIRKSERQRSGYLRGYLLIALAVVVMGLPFYLYRGLLAGLFKQASAVVLVVSLLAAAGMVILQVATSYKKYGLKLDRLEAATKLQH